MSVDGTDFKIMEAKQFNKKWYFHKFNGPGLRYEICLSTLTVHIVWVHGPFPCTSYSALKIFQLPLKGALGLGKMVVASCGYKNKSCHMPSGLNDTKSKKEACIRARHETLNRRLKQF